MAVSYTCPNPDCGVTLKTPNRVAAGKSVKCPKCGKSFVPEGADEEPKAGPGTLKFADEPGDKKKPAKGKPGAKPKPQPEPPKEEPKPADAYGRKPDDEEDDESIKRGYGVIQESEAEIQEAEKNKPKFTEVQDKFKKSARGPAVALLVMPSNLLIAEGLITVAIGIAIFIWGMWPLVFNDAPPGDEETEEALTQMALGLVAFFWGALVCYGTSQMQELKSYTWAMVGAVAGILPLLVGIFAVVMLQNPKVKDGFEEGEGGPDEEDEDEEDEDDDDKKDDDDDDDKDKRKKGKGARGKDDDDDDEDEKPRKKRG